MLPARLRKLSSRCCCRPALQGGDGSDPYLKASATCKHFIGNDLEGWQGVTRHNFDANISAADMRDTFMPPFEACVQRARAGSVMCSYNRRESWQALGRTPAGRGWGWWAPAMSSQHVCTISL